VGEGLCLKHQAHLVESLALRLVDGHREGELDRELLSHPLQTPLGILLAIGELRSSNEMD
jgi:hypothetical protein